MYIPGSFVIYDGRTAIVADIEPPSVLVLHFVDENGETVMQESNDVCPMTGNPRTHVTYQQFVPESEVVPAPLDAIPRARWPQAQEESLNNRQSRKATGSN